MGASEFLTVEVQMLNSEYEILSEKAKPTRFVFSSSGRILTRFRRLILLLLLRTSISFRNFLPFM